MAKSNLKSLNFNFITQYSNNTVSSKISYNYYAHFFLYYNYIFFGLSTSFNKVLLKNTHDVKQSSTFDKHKIAKISLIYLLKRISLRKLYKLPSFELELNMFNINNKIVITHTLFNFNFKQTKKKIEFKASQLIMYNLIRLVYVKKHNWLKKIY